MAQISLIYIYEGQTQVLFFTLGMAISDDQCKVRCLLSLILHCIGGEKKIKESKNK